MPCADMTRASDIHKKQSFRIPVVNGLETSAMLPFLFLQLIELIILEFICPWPWEIIPPPLLCNWSDGSFYVSFSQWSSKFMSHASALLLSLMEWILLGYLSSMALKSNDSCLRPTSHIYGTDLCVIPSVNGVPNSWVMIPCFFCHWLNGSF